MLKVANDAPWLATVLEATGASRCSRGEVVQSLWSGYGQILRCFLQGGEHPTVIVKHVRWPQEQQHPRGWSGARSHARKARSYQVELCWYRDYAPMANGDCRLPTRLAAATTSDGMVLVLEDLDAAGFCDRRHVLDELALRACIDWLANFHATYMSQRPRGLWQVGTYWHLDTRPDELEVLRSRVPALADAARGLDERLRKARFQTLVHGDAKVANFCFARDGSSVAAVDFQYVGGGCGMKDLAYFLSSCLDESQCAEREAELLAWYFASLRQALLSKSSSLDFDALESEWRQLYPVAWTDFFRFLEGWSPGHWKSHGYTRSVARRVLADPSTL